MISFSAKIVWVTQMISRVSWPSMMTDAAYVKRVILVLINNGNDDEWQCQWEEAGLPLGSRKQPAVSWKRCVSGPGGRSVTEAALTFQPKTCIQTLIWRGEHLKWKKGRSLSLSMNTAWGFWDLSPDSSAGRLSSSFNRRENCVGQRKSQNSKPAWWL